MMHIVSKLIGILPPIQWWQAAPYRHSFDSCMYTQVSTLFLPAYWSQSPMYLSGVITHSISPLASPIVIVPKRMEPGQLPKKRLCVDYRVINSLLPKVNKAHSKVKGVLTLVPLPKIDEIYARLKGSTIYSSFDAWSGYHHMEHSAKARPKSAFITPTNKYEFTRCPFGLTQVPVYFQRLINNVLAGLDFAF